MAVNRMSDADWQLRRLVHHSDFQAVLRDLDTHIDARHRQERKRAGVSDRGLATRALTGVKEVRGGPSFGALAPNSVPTVDPTVDRHSYFGKARAGGVIGTIDAEVVDNLLPTGTDLELSIVRRRGDVVQEITDPVNRIKIFDGFQVGTISGDELLDKVYQQGDTFWASVTNGDAGVWQIDMHEDVPLSLVGED